MRRSQRKSTTLLANNDGLTLVEVMMTLLIFATVLAVINNVFFTTQNLYSSTSQRASMQMSARSGLGVMVTEIRAAGCDPTETGIAGVVRATQDSLHFQSDIDGSGDISTAEPSEDVVYFYDAAAKTLYRDPGTGAQVMMPNVTAFSFAYFDENNNAIGGGGPLNSAQAALIRSVAISITIETNQGGEMDASTRIGMRNLQG